MADVAARVLVRGRVQGVGFRAWTAAEARRRGLAGWVRNRRDGGVEACFRGDPAAVDAMVEACRQGPGGARVDDLVQEALAVEELTAGTFRQRSTE